ncbi:MAG: GNAT family N-acetyltransferase [Thermodesulfobacteriota bacterium]
MSVLHGREGFEQLAARWEQLALRSGQVRFFQHPDWYRALFDAALANPDRFLFVTVSDGPDLVALLPLQADCFRAHGTTVHTLGLCDHPHMVLADGLIDQTRQWTWLIPSLIDWLHDNRPVGWDLLKLDKVPQRSALCRLLQAEPPRRVSPAMTGMSAHMSTENLEVALGPVSASFKRNLRRLAKRAEESAPLRYEVYDTPPELERAYPIFLEVEASGWKGAGGLGTAIAQEACLVGFYRGLARRFGARGQCVISHLRYGDQVVASQFGLLLGGTLNILKIGYREEYAWFAPGNLAMERTIRWCCERPDVHELSFVTSPHWGHLWKPQLETVTSFRIFNPTLKGRLLSIGLHMKHEYDRRHHRNGATAPDARLPGAGGADVDSDGRPGTPETPSHFLSRDPS